MSKSQPDPDKVFAAAPVSRSAEVMRILLLEDSPGEAELFCHALVVAWERLESKLKSPRPSIDVQYTAQDALEVLRKQVALGTRGLPDLVVLDLDLPGGTSLIFLRELQKDSRLANLPVIAMVWTDDRAIVRTLAGFGVLDYVVKPMLFGDLVTIVDCFCQQILSETPRQDLHAVDGRRPA
jgi:DNA-binding response OmpR family regulator